MPKETITTKNGTDFPTEIHVGWSKDGGYVQLATQGRYHGRKYEAGAKDGIFADLSRQQINALIRNLRKARDQAYGADE